MSISEPATLLTDYLLAVISTVFGVVLLRARTHRSTLAWSIGFLTLAAAGLTGGSFHGFRTMMTDGAHRSLWNITLILIGAAAGFMISGALTGSLSRYDRNTKWHAVGVVVSIVGLVIQQGHLSPHPSFNHNDLFHCVQIVALYCFFRGAKLTA